MRPLLKYLLPASGLLVLLIAVGLQVLAAFSSPPASESSRPPLAEAIPTELPGWAIRELDLGATESVTEQSLKILNLDDYVHREYTHPEGSFSVYVAWWGPGKMPIRLVNQHTPDRCWTENGWTCTDRRFHVDKTAAGRQLHPAQWGAYQIGEFANESYFWHIVGEEAYWFGGDRMNTRTTVSSVLLDLKNFTTNNRPEQFFVRLVSQQSLDELWELPGFQAVMDDLASLCLARPQRED